MSNKYRFQQDNKERKFIVQLVVIVVVCVGGDPSIHPSILSFIHPAIKTSSRLNCLDLQRSSTQTRTFTSCQHITDKGTFQIFRLLTMNKDSWGESVLPEQIFTYPCVTLPPGTASPAQVKVAAGAKHCPLCGRAHKGGGDVIMYVRRRRRVLAAGVEPNGHVTVGVVLRLLVLLPVKLLTFPSLCFVCIGSC